MLIAFVLNEAFKWLEGLLVILYTKELLLNNGNLENKTP